MVFLAPLLAGLTTLKGAALAYLVKNGFSVAVKAAPLSATVLLGLVLYLAVGTVLKVLVVALLVAAFALGFEVRGYLPTSK